MLNLGKKWFRDSKADAERARLQAEQAAARQEQILNQRRAEDAMSEYKKQSFELLANEETSNQLREAFKHLAKSKKLSKDELTKITQIHQEVAAVGPENLTATQLDNYEKTLDTLIAKAATGDDPASQQIVNNLKNIKDKFTKIKKTRNDKLDKADTALNIDGSTESQTNVKSNAEVNSVRTV